MSVEDHGGGYSPDDVFRGGYADRVATPREPETEAGRDLIDWDLNGAPMSQAEFNRRVLAIEVELRAKLAAEAARLRRIHSAGSGRRGDEREYLDYSEVTRLLRGDSGGVA